MSWNYRVIKHKTDTGNPEIDKLEPEWFGLHEVYYDKDGKIDGWTEDPEAVGNTLDDLRSSLRMMSLAADAATPTGKMSILEWEKLNQ